MCKVSCVCMCSCMFLWVIFDVASTKAGLGKGGLLGGPWPECTLARMNGLTMCFGVKFLVMLAWLHSAQCTIIKMALLSFSFSMKAPDF